MMYYITGMAMSRMLGDEQMWITGRLQTQLVGEKLLQLAAQFLLDVAAEKLKAEVERSGSADGPGEITVLPVAISPLGEENLIKPYKAIAGEALGGQGN